MVILTGLRSVRGEELNKNTDVAATARHVEYVFFSEVPIKEELKNLGVSKWFSAMTSETISILKNKT